MNNLKVTSPAIESERPTKKQKKLNYPQKMHLVLKLVYMHILQQRLVKHKVTGHNNAKGVIDQTYNTTYSYSPDVVKTGSVCKKTKKMLEEYGVSEIKRILTNHFTWMKIIKDGVNLCYSSTYFDHYHSYSLQFDFYPMHKWMPNFSFVRHTLSFRGKTFGTMHMTRLSDKKKGNSLVARLTISTSDGHHVELEPFVVKVEEICFNGSTWDSEEDVKPSELRQWLGKQNIDIKNYVVGQAIHFFQQ